MPKSAENGIISDDSKQKTNDRISINASYAFGALPDQRLFKDNKCIPYVMDETFRWTILYGTKVKPPQLRRVAFERIVGVAIISDGSEHCYCIYGTRDGLFYNNSKGKCIKIIDAMVDGVFRQNDYLFDIIQYFID